MNRCGTRILTLLLLFSMLTACKGGGGDTSSTPDSPESSNVTATAGGDITTTTSAAQSTTDINSSETGDTVTNTTDTTEQTDAQTQGGGQNSATTASKTSSLTTTKTATTTAKKEENGVNMDAIFAPILKKNPRVVRVADYDPADAAWSNIRAITYDGADLGGKKTKIFAYIGYPEGASSTNKAPAVVLVHGGGGHAFAEWVKLWTDRGYVAIAMDTTGFFPSEAGKGKAGRESDDPNKLWHYGLYGAFEEAGYVNAPNNDDMAHPEKPVEQQWMYHAVSSAILAHNLLKADPCVDNSRIGITGISWGCRITALAIGYDTDFAFAIPVYGGGYEVESVSYGGNRYRESALTRAYWTPEERFDRVDFPVYWLSWAADISDVSATNGVSLSYLDTKKAGARMNVKPRWNHSHGSGWSPEDIYLFADSVVMGKAAFTSVVEEPVVTKAANGSRTVTLTIDPADNATKVSAQIAYLTGPLADSYAGGKWSGKQDWKGTTKSTVTGDTVTLTLPKNAVDFYVIISTKTTEGTYEVCSKLVEQKG